MEQDTERLLGAGVYTVPEVSRLTGVSGRRIRRWLTGSTPLWQPDIAAGEALILSFRDLLEIRFVNAFRKHRVSWRSIRTAAERAAEIIQDSHPFSTKRFKTDGRSIFADIVQASGEESLLDLVQAQYAFKTVVDPFLFEGLEFPETGIAPVRWWPLGPERSVVIDPQRLFGQPIVTPGSVPTRILAQALRAEGSVAAVAHWYDVDPQAVEDAAEFENGLAAAA